MARHISNSLLSVHGFPVTLDSKQSHSSIWKSKNVFLSSAWWKREWFCISTFSSWRCHLTAPASAKQARSKPKEALQKQVSLWSSPGGTPFILRSCKLHVLCRFNQGLYVSLNKESPQNGQQANIFFKPAISQLVLHGLKPYGWRNYSCTLQSTFNTKGKYCCCLTPVALHFSAI